MSTYTLTCGGVTQSMAQWGFQGVRVPTKSCQVGKMTFTARQAKVDDAVALAYRAWVTVQKDGAPFFAGYVTKTPRQASGRSESISYEISDPWWLFEQLVFQQMFVTATVAGEAVTLAPTTHSDILLGRSLDATKMNLGQVMREVIYYVLYAAAGQAFPTTVDAGTHICAPPAFGAGVVVPFTVGLLTPAITIPYTQPGDKMCAEVIKYCLRWVADAVQWFDFSSATPVLNIDQRPALTSKTISLFGGTVVNPNAFNPTSRDDLVVPVVILKYKQTNTVDGETYAATTVDKYPLDVADNSFGALVATIDLAGANATYQHQDIIVQNLPVSAGGTATLPWLWSHVPELFGSASGASGYDVGTLASPHVTVTAFLGKDLDPQDPFATGFAPAGFAPGNMTEELLSGGVTKWMEDDGIFSAKMVLSFRLTYTGSDPVTLAFFNNDPANPGTYLQRVTVGCTNADTMTYKQLTSSQPPEPVPVGLAEAMFHALNPLHFDGDLLFKEAECSGQLAVGQTFNTSDGRAEWRTMNAQVLSVDQDIDKGETRVRFGPPVVLGAQERTELLRANRGRIFSWQLDQKSSGIAGGANAVIGHTRTPHHAAAAAPPVATEQIGPFKVTYGENLTSDGGHTYTYWVQVDLNGEFLDQSGAQITVSGLGTKIPLLGSGDTVWLDGDVASLAYTEVDLCSFGNGNNTLTPGAGYWTDGGLTEDDGATPPSQTAFRKVIAEFVAGAMGQPVLKTRKTTTNLQLFNVFIDPEPAIYPYPI